jgi:hypothetical protein
MEAAPNIAIALQAMKPDVDALFGFHSWDGEQVKGATIVYGELARAYKKVLELVPDNEYRDKALDLIFMARQYADAAFAKDCKPFHPPPAD